MHRIILFIVTILPAYFAQAQTWILPPSDIDIFGQIQTVAASREETLLDIARQHDIGQVEILLANPNVDRWLPADGEEVILPSRFIIPQAERKGLVLNLAEMRLYFFPVPEKGEKPVIITHPVGIGRMDWVTPIGVTKIVEKKKDPTWTPPQSVRDEAIAKGNPPLPNVVPAGPDNPLGRFAMRLGITSGSYLMHGTNKPYGVGMRVSHGCIRLYPEDIESLFVKVPVGAQMQLVNQPIKLGWLGGLLFIELHPPLEEDEEKYADYTQMVYAEIQDFLMQKASSTHVNFVAGLSIDDQALEQAIIERSGIPVLISR